MSKGRRGRAAVLLKHQANRQRAACLCGSCSVAVSHSFYLEWNREKEIRKSSKCSSDVTCLCFEEKNYRGRRGGVNYFNSFIREWNTAPAWRLCIVRYRNAWGRGCSITAVLPAGGELDGRGNKAGPARGSHSAGRRRRKVAPSRPLRDWRQPRYSPCGITEGTSGGWEVQSCFLVWVGEVCNPRDSADPHQPCLLSQPS